AEPLYVPARPLKEPEHFLEADLVANRGLRHLVLLWEGCKLRPERREEVEFTLPALNGRGGYLRRVALRCLLCLRSAGLGSVLGLGWRLCTRPMRLFLGLFHLCGRLNGTGCG